MAELCWWESEFVRRYVVREKRERYLHFLKGRKHRRKVLERLHHHLDYDPAHAREFCSEWKDVDRLLDLLGSLHVDGTAYIMSDALEDDGRELRLEPAVEALLGTMWGALIICPPVPIALYKPEDPGAIVLLSRERD